jgi:hypothetical protein
LEKQLDLGLRAARAMQQAADAMAEIGEARMRLPPQIVASDPELEQILAGLGKANRDLGAVLEVAKSADRRPPSQAGALFTEASANLATELGKWNAVKGMLPHAP